ncbi:MAG: DnaJ domain-containing protein [Clostridia bacterium]|nr:DnaJ domain-containing protein [Clostridia bacterium]
MKEYYELLGLSESATDEEIDARYQELRAKYNEDRWLDGEAGNEAARMLTKLDVAYAEIKDSRKEQSKNTEGESSFEEITALIKENKINEAQARLDDFNERSAEWHYLQAVVFYKKNWTSDSKKQLEIAIQMDPDNQKYRSAYGKMNAKNNYEQQEYQRRQQETQNPYSRQPDEQMGGNACSNCISCCYTYLCVDCLFSLCCGCR